MTKRSKQPPGTNENHMDDVFNNMRIGQEIFERVNAKLAMAMPKILEEYEKKLAEQLKVYEDSLESLKKSFIEVQLAFEDKLVELDSEVAVLQAQVNALENK